VFEPLLTYAKETTEQEELPEELPDELWHASPEPEL